MPYLVQVNVEPGRRVQSEVGRSWTTDAVCSDGRAQTLLTPPSTTMSEPVMNELSSEDLSAEDMLPLLLQKKLDIALTLPPHNLPRELNMKELERYEPCVAVGKTHPLAKSKCVSLNQMASEPVAALARKDYPQYHKHLKKLFATIGRKAHIGSEYDSGTSLMAAGAAGHEFTLLPSCVSGAAGRRLKLLKLRPALPPWSIVALWRKDAETESIRAFIAAALRRST
jgi:DNA-binding transcriptional LysR family regulator